MIEATYKDISNDWKNVIGLFYETREDINSSLKKYEVQTYILIYENNEIYFKKYALYSLKYKSELSEIKCKLKIDGYINLKEWSQINKERLIGKEDILTLIKKM